MTTASVDDLIARNPADGSEIGRVPVTPPGDVAAVVDRAREAQSRWRAVGFRQRREVLETWYRRLAKGADDWADLIRAEVGKPRAEAMAGDVIAALDGIRWTVRNAGRVLSGGTIGSGHQRFMQVSAARLGYRPVGVVGVIGTWNYPLFLNAPVIAQALAAGNAVVWKSSELAPLCGRRLQEAFEAAGFPDGLVGLVTGGPDVGRALTASAIDKAVFTGGVENGRRVLSALAARGVPAVAELSGFDAAVVLPDATTATAARPLAWSAFVGAGQTCVSVKRIYVVGDPHPWCEALRAIADGLRVGDPARPDIDVGPMINAAARERFHASVQAAAAAGARVVAGGTPLSGPGWFYRPTVLRATTPEPEALLAGVFGPVVVVRGVPDADAAVSAANASPYGLAASVWSGDVRAARRLARRLDAGMVTINEAVTPTMHASAPFGGTKASGHGRTHGPLGLLEFVQPQTVFTRRPGGFRPEIYPYGVASVGTFIGLYRRLFHGR